jgi:chitin synthase
MCLLLIKDGWTLTYTANATAYTRCPETIDAFMIQRRRWIPSTLVNLLEFLKNKEAVLRRNPRISTFFVFYTALLLFSAVLSPPVTSLVLSGGWALAFNSSLVGPTFFAVGIPCLFALFCLFACPDGTVFLSSNKAEVKKLLQPGSQYTDPNFKSWRQHVQIRLATWLTFVYAVFSLACLVGIVAEIKEHPSAPSSVFLFVVVGIVFVSSILHGEPQLLILGILYLLGLGGLQILLVIFITVRCSFFLHLTFCSLYHLSSLFSLFCFFSSD